MNEELIEVLDENGNGTGIIKHKFEIKEKGLFHRGISICILNKNNEIVMHKRSSNKKVYPNLWSCFVRGHVKAHENSIDTCIREVNEELGINLDIHNIKFLYTSKNIEKNPNKNYINNIFFDNYITTVDVGLSDLKLQDDEVSEAKLISYSEFKNLVNNNSNILTPNFEDYKNIISILDSK